jgi:hypothetical protein
VAEPVSRGKDTAIPMGNRLGVLGAAIGCHHLQWVGHCLWQAGQQVQVSPVPKGAPVTGQHKLNLVTDF